MKLSKQKIDRIADKIREFKRRGMSLDDDNINRSSISTELYSMNIRPEEWNDIVEVIRYYSHVKNNVPGLFSKVAIKKAKRQEQKSRETWRKIKNIFFFWK